MTPCASRVLVASWPAVTLLLTSARGPAIKPSTLSRNSPQNPQNITASVHYNTSPLALDHGNIPNINIVYNDIALWKDKLTILKVIFTLNACHHNIILVSWLMIKLTNARFLYSTVYIKREWIMLIHSAKNIQSPTDYYYVTIRTSCWLCTDSIRQVNNKPNKYYAELQRKPLHIVELVH